MPTELIKRSALESQIQGEIAWAKILNQRLRPSINVTEEEIDEKMAASENSDGAWGPGAEARAHTSHDYAYGAAYLRVRPGEIGGIKYILYVTHAPTRARRAPPMPRPGRGRA